MDPGPAICSWHCLSVANMCSYSRPGPVVDGPIPASGLGRPPSSRKPPPLHAYEPEFESSLSTAPRTAGLPASDCRSRRLGPYARCRRPSVPRCLNRPSITRIRSKQERAASIPSKQAAKAVPSALPELAQVLEAQVRRRCRRLLSLSLDLGVLRFATLRL